MFATLKRGDIDELLFLSYKTLSLARCIRSYYTICRNSLSYKLNKNLSTKQSKLVARVLFLCFITCMFEIIEKIFNWTIILFVVGAVLVNLCALIYLVHLIILDGIWRRKKENARRLLKRFYLMARAVFF